LWQSDQVLKPQQTLDDPHIQVMKFFQSLDFPGMAIVKLREMGCVGGVSAAQRRVTHRCSYRR